ncbi:MAG TPA: biotin--[acetyl-CoA-carboxylase] ligase, partial [Nocardioidaceae bacterium]|nr:biotin--[acetyl-CoA-carboxylase] ligase [Nocardioidaceae bacterium]
MPGRWTDLDRPPLSAARLNGALCRGGLWREIRVVDETASTNADVCAAAEDGAAEGLVVVAEHQSAGQGRLGRVWESPRYAGLTFSVLLHPSVADRRWPWLPLLTGIAV